uniref:Endonuclease/exonuclease/phosphatase domain-containing protein n=1 Tax=Alexandrium monilatum TaxID=311494 RepID=A0A6T1E2S6_9DINO
MLRRARPALRTLATAGSRAQGARGLAGPGILRAVRLSEGSSQEESPRVLLGAALAGLGTAALALTWQPPRKLCCETTPVGTGQADVRVVTYNLLSPPLATPSHFPKCAPEDVDHRNRFPKILARLEGEVAARAVIGLQEVNLGWAGQLHAFFAERGYTAVFAQYGKTPNGYMGVMLAWPTARFEVQDVEISRLSDTAPKQTWPKTQKAAASPLNPYGFMTRQGLKDVLGCWPPTDPKAEPGSFEWSTARDRLNEAIFVRLKPRGPEPGKAFVVSTYHMPCLFGEPEKVRVVNIHAYLLLSRLRAFASGDPAVLMGDFNVKPGTSSYHLLASGGSLDAAAAAPHGPEEVFGLRERLPAGRPWPEGMVSAYCRFHGSEPLFTNFAQTSGHSEPFVETLDYIWYTPDGFSVVACPELPKRREDVAGPFPNRQEPSDHVLLGATLRLGAAA